MTDKEMSAEEIEEMRKQYQVLELTTRQRLTYQVMSKLPELLDLALDGLKWRENVNKIDEGVK